MVELVIVVKQWGVEGTQGRSPTLNRGVGGVGGVVICMSERGRDGCTHPGTGGRGAGKL